MMVSFPRYFSILSIYDWRIIVAIFLVFITYRWCYFNDIKCLMFYQNLWLFCKIYIENLWLFIKIHSKILWFFIIIFKWYVFFRIKMLYLHTISSTRQSESKLSLRSFVLSLYWEPTKKRYEVFEKTNRQRAWSMEMFCWA